MTTHSSAPMPRTSIKDMDRERLLEDFQRVRLTTEWICEPLTTEDTVVQTSVECSPTKWQLAHVTWFFETFVLLPYLKGYREFHPQYGYFFNSYYNSIGDRTPRDMRGLMSRPTLGEVWDYRRHIEKAMEHLLSEADDSLLVKLKSIITLGNNHEQQHQELMLTDVKTVLAMNPLRPIYREREITSASIPPIQWISFEEGLREIGASGKNFFFDNEGPRHKEYIPSFQLGHRLVTNAEYKEFIADGCYSNPQLWLADGFAKVVEEGWQAPKYWEQTKDGWMAMTLQGLRPVEDSEPVTHISQFEADAFATWAGGRLPTESEWELAASPLPIEGNFLDNGNFHPVPLPSRSSNPLQQMFGDVWEWTRSAYLPYHGFKVAEGALGEYNGKFMSNQMVLRGGSCATPKDHIRATYRNFFPPDARWQFSGIRLAKDV